MSDRRCTLCGTAYVRTWQVPDRRFGTDETFEFGECGACPALILTDPPADPGPYYPATYASFHVNRPAWRRPLRRLRNRLLLGRRGPVARLLSAVRPHADARLLHRTGTTPDSRVLDVGSGGGGLLRDLADAGFEHAVGVDRFIPEAVDGGRYRVVKGTLDEVEGQFDLVMLHHSLEHMRDQAGTLRQVVRLLAPGGWCVIRIPVFPSRAWHTYHENWFQLDPPRHEYIHSVASLTRVAAEAGLSLTEVEFDSTSSQFAISEGYRQGLDLRTAEANLPAGRLREWERRAREVNAEGAGDQAAFYFRAAYSEKLAGVR